MSSSRLSPAACRTELDTDRDVALSVHRLTKAQGRRIAVRAQLLDAPRPSDLRAVVQQLTLLQIEPTAAIAPSADLVAWSRLGSAYQPVDLKQALEQDRTLFEHNALVRPTSDLGLYLAGAADWPPYERTRAWIRENDRFRRDILNLLRSSGPLTSRDIPDTSVVAWASSGWTGNRNVTQMLECLMMRGEVAIAWRSGRERLWDLAERVYPDDVIVPPVEEARRIKNERRLRAPGIARHKTTAMPVEPADVGEAGEPAVVEGTKGEWRVDPAALGGDFEGRTALLSLVGKVDAIADRKVSVLRVNAIHEDVEFTRYDEGRAGRARRPGIVARPECGVGEERFAEARGSPDAEGLAALARRDRAERILPLTRKGVGLRRKRLRGRPHRAKMRARGSVGQASTRAMC